MAVNQSNLPTIQRLKYEDYARQPNWQAAFQALINTLNLFITPVYNILNAGIGYMNLVLPQIYTVTITAAADPLTTFTFTNPLSIQPSAVMVGNVWSGVPSNHPSGGIDACQVFWHFTQDTIIVDNITGLNPGVQYTITLVVL